MFLDEVRNLQQTFGALMRRDAWPRTVLECFASSLDSGVHIGRVSFRHRREYFFSRRIDRGKSSA